MKSSIPYIFLNSCFKNNNKKKWAWFEKCSYFTKILENKYVTIATMIYVYNIFWTFLKFFLHSCLNDIKKNGLDLNIFSFFTKIWKKNMLP
jgi:hypothetical protein